MNLVPFRPADHVYCSSVNIDGLDLVIQRESVYKYDTPLEDWIKDWRDERGMRIDWVPRSLL